MTSSKPLAKSDSSGFYFAQEMLSGDSTAGINFDRLQKSPEGRYIIFEYLLCEEAQFVTPFTSHPKRYWHKNRRKFLSLWGVAKDLNATLYLVNYAKKGTLHENKVLLIKVLDINREGILKEEITQYTRNEFGIFFRKLNKECLTNIKI